MSNAENVNQIPVKAQHKPRCPYCQQDPIAPMVTGMTIPPGLICRAISCASCRALYNIQIIGEAGARETPQQVEGYAGMPAALPPLPDKAR